MLLNCGVGEDSSNQSVLKEISPGYSLEGLMLTLKLQYFGHLMHRGVMGDRAGPGVCGMASEARQKPRPES